MIDLTEQTNNTERRFGSAKHYHGCVVRTHRGIVAALFTDQQIDEAIARAEANPEDAPDVRPWWRKLLRAAR